MIPNARTYLSEESVRMVPVVSGFCNYKAVGSASTDKKEPSQWGFMRFSEPCYMSTAVRTQVTRSAQ